MNLLLELDQQLFYLVNHLPHTQLLNTLALMLSGIGTAGIVWFILGIWLILREEKKDHWFFAPLLLAGAGTGIIVNLLLKPLIARVRPTIELGAIIMGEQSLDYSFPSGHATIAFAMAVVLTKKEPKWRWILFMLATAISLSRIFLGKHFPLDVMAGGILGWCIGHFSLRLAKRMRLNK